ncbi:hypothetical protein [Streptomyces sp. NPDC058572]|uniref:hypothetical protein n=1 Tax=Streptomyces sp. NPDC058572 TaxID=3346546 RepID=UPI00365E1CEE
MTPPGPTRAPGRRPAWQVTVLGLGPVRQSDNVAARTRAAELLTQGEQFGLSEKVRPGHATPRAPTRYSRAADVEDMSG